MSETVEASVTRLLLVATHRASASVEQRLRKDGFAVADALLLAAVAERGPLRMTEVARALGVPPSTATSLVDRLERKGLASRSPHAQDARSLVVSLTRTGRFAARRAQKAIAEVDAEIADTASADKLAPGKLAQVLGDWAEPEAAAAAGAS